MSNHYPVCNPFNLLSYKTNATKPMTDWNCLPVLDNFTQITTLDPWLYWENISIRLKMQKLRHQKIQEKTQHGPKKKPGLAKTGQAQSKPRCTNKARPAPRGLHRCLLHGPWTRSMHSLACFLQSTRPGMDQTGDGWHGGLWFVGAGLVHSWEACDGPWWSKHCFRRFKN